MMERAKQALVKLALEPAWEAVFEPNSYGFRPGRSCHDAIGAIFLGIRYKPKFVSDADITGCFDTIDHEALLKKLNTYPKLTLKAPDFDREWNWIGSYAPWRAAMLVFMYPENVLHPALRDRQSPGFKRLVRDSRALPEITPEAGTLVIISRVENPSAIFSPKMTSTRPGNSRNTPRPCRTSCWK